MAYTSTIAHTVPVIVRNDEEVTQPNPTIDIGDREPGNTTTEGGENGLVTSGPIGTGHTIAPPPRIEEPVRIADEMPEFIGDLNRYLALRITYPQRAREAGIEGKVIVQFVVDERGNVTFAKVLRGIGGGCDEEALRVVNSMPGWKPGKQNGIAVKVYYTLPIRFMLE
jgi:protein TonB